MPGLLRRSWKALRTRTGPLRHRLLERRDQRAIQRSIPLAREDRTYKRRRWHVLVDLVHERCPASDVVVAEIGVADGYSTAHMLKYCPQISRIYAIDLIRPDLETSRVADLERVEFVQGYSDECAKRFDDGSLDLIFIDADHSEEWVLRDLAAWVPKAKAGGVLAGHDYDSHRYPGVKLAVDAFFERHPTPLQLDRNRVWWTLK